MAKQRVRSLQPLPIRLMVVPAISMENHSDASVIAPLQDIWIFVAGDSLLFNPNNGAIINLLLGIRYYLVPENGRVGPAYFAGKDPMHGYEMWNSRPLHAPDLMRDILDTMSDAGLQNVMHDFGGALRPRFKQYAVGDATPEWYLARHLEWRETCDVAVNGLAPPSYNVLASRGFREPDLVSPYYPDQIGQLAPHFAGARPFNGIPLRSYPVPVNEDRATGPSPIKVTYPSTSSSQSETPSASSGTPPVYNGFAPTTQYQPRDAPRSGPLGPSPIPRKRRISSHSASACEPSF